LRSNGFARGLFDIFSLSERETLYMAFLTALLVFSSTIACLNTEVVTSPSPMIIVHVGFPFENVRQVYTFKNITVPIHMAGEVENLTLMESSVEITWLGLALDLGAYALLSLFIVKAISKIKEEIDYRRYPD